MRRALFLSCGLLLAHCASSRSTVRQSGAQVGVASYYADSLAGRKTASGEPYDPLEPTCAHRTLPFGTRVEVVVLESRRSTTCRVNDRGPFVSGRIIDLSRSVAEELRIVDQGLARVSVRPL